MSANKTAIVVLSDPRSESDEAFGRVFNALATATDLKRHGAEVQIVFHGAGTRWPEELVKDDHPANALFRGVSELVAGASCGCADAFGARDGVEACGLELLTDNEVAGTNGLGSLAGLAAQGFQILTF